MISPNMLGLSKTALHLCTPPQASKQTPLDITNLKIFFGNVRHLVGFLYGEIQWILYGPMERMGTLYIHYYAYIMYLYIYIYIYIYI